MEVRIIGADQIKAVAEAARRFGNAHLLTQTMEAELRNAPAVVERAAQARARQILPHRGGLAARVARYPVRSKVRRSGNTVTVQMSTRAGRIDAGRVTHPTFGHEPRVTQSVPPGFFSTPATQKGRESLRKAGKAALAKAKVFSGG